jgi:hypothetical protein
MQNSNRMDVALMTAKTTHPHGLNVDTSGSQLWHLGLRLDQRPSIVTRTGGINLRRGCQGLQNLLLALTSSYNEPWLQIKI